MLQQNLKLEAAAIASGCLARRPHPGAAPCAHHLDGTPESPGRG